MSLPCLEVLKFYEEVVSGCDLEDNSVIVLCPEDRGKEEIVLGKENMHVFFIRYQALVGSVVLGDFLRLTWTSWVLWRGGAF